MSRDPALFREPSFVQLDALRPPSRYVASSKLGVTLVDTNEQTLNSAVGRIQTSVARVAKKQFSSEADIKAFIDQTMVLYNSHYKNVIFPTSLSLSSYHHHYHNF
jgi:hypothetical protein